MLLRLLNLYFFFFAIYPVLPDPAEIPRYLHQLGSSQKNKNTMPSHSIEGTQYGELGTGVRRAEKAHRERKSNAENSNSQKLSTAWLEEQKLRWYNYGLRPLAEAGTVVGQPDGSWNNNEVTSPISTQKTEILLSREEQKYPGFSLHSTFPPIIHQLVFSIGPTQAEKESGKCSLQSQPSLVQSQGKIIMSLKVNSQISVTIPHPYQPYMYPKLKVAFIVSYFMLPCDQVSAYLLFSVIIHERQQFIVGCEFCLTIYWFCDFGQKTSLKLNPTICKTELILLPISQGFDD